MRILWDIHLYPPKHNCGSEWMAHHINKFLQECGHEIKILHRDGSKYGIHSMYHFDGIDVFPPESEDSIYRWADIVCTHLDYSKKAIAKCKDLGKPVLFFNHNTHDKVYRERLTWGNVGIVHNSYWSKEHLKYPNPSVVVFPPVDWRYYDVMDHDPNENEFITLIGLSMNKGGEVLYKLAEAFPERKFLGVKGSYDPQILDPRLKNVTVIENTPEIRDVYKKTRILIMPSTYESWGRTATEAMCNGIPVICNPTPGLKENCDFAGIYCDLTSLDGWIKAIKKLDSKTQYKHYSKLAEKRSRQLQPTNQLNDLNEFIFKMVRGQRVHVSG